jgi:hypothetical protein
MINCSFLPVFYEYHQCKKSGKPLPDFENYMEAENAWMSFYGLGRLEAYRFIYSECTGIRHLQEWLIGLKGAAQALEAAAAFEQWVRQGKVNSNTADTAYFQLSDAQMRHWNEQGYVKVSGLVDEHLCDAVISMICEKLGADMAVPSTWYSGHTDWHGLMLQVYQDESINAIKQLPAIRQLFAGLYGTTSIAANTEKVSFNPPETASWKFAHNKLHWDVDFENADIYYIQGLVYLNDVPENRGPLTLVPGFHHRFESWMATHPDPHEAHQAMQNTFSGTPVPGKKGDIILWQQTLPHAASANHSDVPRFVQYISFSKL